MGLSPETLKSKAAARVAQMSDDEVAALLRAGVSLSSKISTTIPHRAQQIIIDESARFNVVCAGRRFGKSRFGLNRCIEPALIEHSLVGWFAPTYKNLSEMWRELLQTFEPVITKVSEVEKRVQLEGGGVIEMWSMDAADSARGRHYKRVILDECAMVKDLEDIWHLIIRPMLVDFAGDAYFLSTPRGKNFFMKMFEWGQDKEYPLWNSWRFPTSANPYLPETEIVEMKKTMVMRAFEQEIEAKFIDEVSGAMWKQTQIDINRCEMDEVPELGKRVVAIDPAVTSRQDSDETGIILAAVAEEADGTQRHHGYLLADVSGTYTPEEWARKAIALYWSSGADYIVAEANQGGDLVLFTLRTIDYSVPVKLVHASKGKLTRAEPIVALDEQGLIHHAGYYPELEMQMTSWSPIDDPESPDRVDARVWAFSELMLKRPRKAAISRQG